MRAPLGRALLQKLISRLPVDRYLVNPGYQGSTHDLLPLLRGDGANLAVGRADQGAVDYLGSSLFVEEGNQSFANREFCNRSFDIQLGIGAKGLSCGTYRFLVFWRERAKCVLNPVA